MKLLQLTLQPSENPFLDFNYTPSIDVSLFNIDAFLNTYDTMRPQRQQLPPSTQVSSQHNPQQNNNQSSDMALPHVSEAYPVSAFVNRVNVTHARAHMGHNMPTPLPLAPLP